MTDPYDPELTDEEVETQINSEIDELDNKDKPGMG